MSDYQYFKAAVDRGSNKIIHIDEVPEGYTGGICPSCKKQLVAANRKKSSGTRKRATYFRHKSQTTCSFMTVLHRWAQEVILEAKRIQYPSVSFEIEVGKYPDTLSEKVYRPPYFVDLEAKLSKLEHTRKVNGKNVRFDAYTKVVNGKELAIEIKVTSAVSLDKRAAIRFAEINCIEIDLSDRSKVPIDNRTDFENYVLNVAPRELIFDEKEKSLRAIVTERCKVKLKQQLEYERQREIYELEYEKQLEEKQLKKSEKIKELIIRLNEPQLLRDLEIYREQKALSYSYIEEIGNYVASLVSPFSHQIINTPVKDETAFRTHRSIWQWLIFVRVVLISADSGYKSITRATNKQNEKLIWKRSANKWTDITLSLMLKQKVKLANLTTTAIRETKNEYLDNSLILPPYMSLSLAEWKKIPKPIEAINQYLNKLQNFGLVQKVDGGYVAAYRVNLPNDFNVNFYNI